MEMMKETKPHTCLSSDFEIWHKHKNNVIITQTMDTHQFTHAIGALEQLPEEVRSRALTIGQGLKDDSERATLAERLTDIGQDLRKTEGEALASLARAEQELTSVEHRWDRAQRSAKEERSQRREMTNIESKLRHLDQPSAPTA